MVIFFDRQIAKMLKALEEFSSKVFKRKASLQNDAHDKIHEWMFESLGFGETIWNEVAPTGSTKGYLLHFLYKEQQHL